MAGFTAIDKEQLFQVNQNKDVEGWASLGGLEGVAKKIQADVRNGLSSDVIEEHRKEFGSNTFKEVPPRSFWSILIETLKDPTLILLMFAATVSTALGAGIKEEREENAWVEGVAIWLAIILVSLVGSLNDYQKELQFRKLNAEKDAIMVKVIRDGKEQLVGNHELVVGDLMMLDTGDKIVADGVYVEGHSLVIDEASLTGESDPIKKEPDGDFWCRSGTQVTDGDGRVLVTAVGPRSEWGMIMDKVTVEEETETPLQQKLGFVAGAIGKVGFAVAVCAFVVMTIRWCVEKRGFPIKEINNNGPIQFFLYAVTIIVVAIPEGLPLAVTISLAYSMKKMMKDNNFVRHLAACETMGGATAICSDKTASQAYAGTLTENRMTVVEGWFSGVKHNTPPSKSQLPPNVAEAIINNICLNSKAFYIEEAGKKTEFVGNRTECALLMLCEKEFGVSYQDVRKKNETAVPYVYGFSSAKKMASCVLDKGDGTLRLLNKGASEWVLDISTHVNEQDGSVVPLSAEKKAELMQVVTEMASRGLRTLALGYSDMPKEDATRPADFFDTPPDKDITVCCIVGIKDPVRKEVPGAVRTCVRAGICVRMVTGDNIHTAKHIARDCGILEESTGGFAMEGPEFREVPREEMMKRLPNLQVLARSSPTDKHTLVNMLREMGEVVAVTGDGTNDAPALKESDVGLAMGIAGTEVAKEAADIVILDDNFKSIVLAVLWGRSVFNNIRKFLQFQLTINIVALIVAFIGAFFQKEPLNVLQLLWVNLIMDTLAALALATENPHISLLNHKPHGRNAPLINSTMWKHMLVQAAYQIFWMLLILFAAPLVFDRYEIRSKCDAFREGHSDDSQSFCSHSDVTGLDLQSQYSATEICSTVTFPLGADGCPTSFKEPSEDFVNSVMIGGAQCVGAACGQLLEDSRKIFEAFDGSRGFYHDIKEEDETTAKSLLFNAFIFMQVFNEINSRKILDEYNIFEGIFTSAIFLGVLAITIILQIIIVMTPLNSIFHVNSLDGVEWAVSIAIGLGVIPLSLLTRWVSRQIFGINVPKQGSDRVDMDIGYGAVVDDGSKELADTRRSDTETEESKALPSKGASHK